MPQAQSQEPPPAPGRPGGRGAPWMGWGAAAGAAAALVAVWVAQPGLLLGAGAGLAHLLGYPWRGEWRLPVAAIRGAVAGGFVLACVWGTGAMLMAGLARRGRWSPMECWALAPLLGAVPLSLGMLGLGCAGRLATSDVAAFSTVAALAAVPGWLRLVRTLSPPHGAAPRAQRRWADRSVAALLVVLWVGVAPYALSPAVESDELRYHLAAPEQWLRAGRIHYLPYQAFSNFPMLGEMLFMWAMKLAGHEAAKFVHWGFSIPVGLMTALAARRMTPASVRRHWAVGRWAALGFAAIPTVPILACWAFVDLFMTAYALGFVYGTGRVATGGHRTRARAARVLGVVAAGAAGVKYSMPALMALIGVPWVVWLARRTGAGRAATLAALAASVGLAGAAPWYLKNLAWTGNPVYPLAQAWFDGGEWTAENAAFYRAKMLEKGFHWRPTAAPVWGRTVELLISPATTALFPQRFENNPLGAVPLMALVAAVGWLAWRQRPRLGAADGWMGWNGASLVLAWVLWFFTYQSNRLLLPACALAVALGAAALARWSAAGGAMLGRALRVLGGVGAATGVAALVAVLGAPTAPGRAGKADGWAVGLGFMDPASYLARRLGYWTLAQRLPEHLPPGGKVLLVGEYRPLHFPVPLVVSDWFDTPQPLPWIRATRSNDEMVEALWRAGVRLVLLNRGELALYASAYFVPRFTTAEFARFTDFWRHPALRLIDRDPAQGIELYELTDPTRPSAPGGERSAAGR